MLKFKSYKYIIDIIIINKIMIQQLFMFNTPVPFIPRLDKFLFWYASNWRASKCLIYASNVHLSKFRMRPIVVRPNVRHSFDLFENLSRLKQYSFQFLFGGWGILVGISKYCVINIYFTRKLTTHFMSY